MSKKQSKNKKCSCGSGKKYKHCHGSTTVGLPIKMSYVFTEVVFGVCEIGKKKLTAVKGYLKNNNFRFNFRLNMTPLENGEWELTNFFWLNRPVDLSFIEVAKVLINKASLLLRTTNMWAGKQTESGAQLSLNQILTPKDDLHTNTISFRSSFLELPSPKWSDLWDRIESRVLSDDYFRVHGFSKEELIIAVKNLKKVFPSDWVRARYAESNTTNNPPGMGDSFKRESSSFWFPAYHLARTSLGAICVDPGWNYLIEIGLSIEELKGFKETNLLLQSLTRSSGTQHHICLAGNLYKRGFLEGLEPTTGSRSATNDLLVKVTNNIYAVEVKEFTSKYPLMRLKKEIIDKSSKLPKNPRNPVIFHVVLKDEKIVDLKRENSFIKSIDSISSDIPTNISAIAVGSRFLDSTGGRVKRKLEKIVVNKNSHLECNLSDIEDIFCNNYSKIIYPRFGVGCFFYFDNDEK